VATIKTQVVSGQRRILTKVVSGQRRVSCSCCEPEECCPYDASQLDEGYATEDLPDTITINDFVPSPRTATRSGTIYDTGNYLAPAFPGGPEVTQSVRLELGIDAFDEIVWQLFVIVEGSDDPPVAFSLCLFYTLPESPSDYSNTEWRDDFLDEYEVSTAGGSFTVTRDSLCVWSGTDPDYNGGSVVTLRLNSPSASRGRANIWTIAGAGRTDAGPYKSPVGTYGVGYVWTVAEP
jgi:hypothetical protein